MPDPILCRPIAKLVMTSMNENQAITSAQLILAVGPWVPIKLITCGTDAAAWPRSVEYAVRYVAAEVVAVIVKALE